MIEVLLSAVSLCIPMVACSSSLALAQGTAPSTEVPRSANRVSTHDQPGGDGIAANGRCGGMSFGTGARRCGTMSGDPFDGIENRN